MRAQLAAASTVVRAGAADALIVNPERASLIVSENLAALPPGRVVAVDSALENILGLFRPLFTFEPVDVRVLQDGPGRRAIVIPVTAAGALSLPGGTYRLRFNIERRRWDTNDPPDALNRYRDEATLSIQL